MKLNNKLYDVLKWVAIIVLPALATFIQVVFAAWNIPYADPICATITALATLLGAILGISSLQYKKNDKSIEEE